MGPQATRHQLSRGPCLVEKRIEDLANSRDQLGSRVAGVGNGKNFLRPGGFALDEVRDTACQHGGFAGAGTRHHQHRTMHMLDGPALLIRRFEIEREIALHCTPNYTKKKRTCYYARLAGRWQGELSRLRASPSLRSKNNYDDTIQACHALSFVCCFRCKRIRATQAGARCRTARTGRMAGRGNLGLGREGSIGRNRDPR